MKQILQNTIVLLTAIILSIIVMPFGIVYNLITSVWNGNLNYFAKVIIRTAVSIDQLGNVVCGELLDRIFTKTGKNFGLEDDTVSEVLAKNQNNVTKLGRLISIILEKIQPGHLNSALTENTYE